MERRRQPPRKQLQTMHQKRSLDESAQSYSIPRKQRGLRTQQRSTRIMLQKSPGNAGNPQIHTTYQKGAKNATGNQTNKKMKISKQNLTIRTRNIRTLYATGKLKELCYEMDRYKCTKWTDTNGMCWVWQR